MVGELLWNYLTNHRAELFAAEIRRCERVWLEANGLQLVQSLACRDHIGYCSGVLQSKSGERKLTDSLHKVAYPVCLLHVVVDKTAQRKHILNV